MALNLATLKTRAFTAIIFVAVMLAGILYNHFSFVVLFLVIAIGCMYEYIKMIRLIDPNFSKFPLPVLVYISIGLTYIIIPAVLMVNLYKQSERIFNGPDWVLPMLIIATIWINDTMAYIVGSMIGKNPLSAVSPKKTWEGTIGGAILAITIVTCTAYLNWGYSIKIVLLIATTAVIAGTFGDLLESKIKRMAGVKDSGQIMPGHGGFLDRFDSLLLAIPGVWLVLFLFL